MPFISTMVAAQKVLPGLARLSPQRSGVQESQNAIKCVLSSFHMFPHFSTFPHIFLFDCTFFLDIPGCHRSSPFEWHPDAFCQTCTKIEHSQDLAKAVAVQCVVDTSAHFCSCTFSPSYRNVGPACFGPFTRSSTAQMVWTMLYRA